ncbi:MAG: hypothetical protein UF030_04920 [Eggerthellaceae bacterium]|nr:hypothetical protein [Eggerthellaceae bacterium]
MLDTAKVEYEKNLLKKKSSTIRTLIVILTSIGGVIAVLLHLIIALNILSNGDDLFFVPQILSLSASAIKSIAIIFALFALSNLFRCISQSHSPINGKLIKELKLIAFLLVLAFIIGSISQLLIPGITSSTQVGELNITYYSDAPNGSMQFQFEYLFVALFCYCLSYIFKYTLCLQQSADDTI